MTEVHLGREFYSQHGEIISWLHENVGNGGSWRMPMQEDFLWDWSVAFGHATVRFRRREDAVLFSLVWP